MKSLILPLFCLLICSCGNQKESTTDSSISEPTGQIAFTSNRGGNNDIYLMNIDGSNIRNITNNPALDYGASWSPDNKQIAAYSNRSGNTELYLFSADGQTSTQLTDHPDQDVLPSISSNGKQIAFMSNRNG